MKFWTSVVLISVLTGGLLLVGGCETQAQNKALLGGAIGAGAGQLIGRDTEGTLIGAGIGAGAGYLWGHSQDKKAEEEQRSRAATIQNDANTTTLWITNSNGSKTPVKLTRTASGGYIGPRGEIYDTLPTEEQLKEVYGF